MNPTRIKVVFESEITTVRQRTFLFMKTRWNPTARYEVNVELTDLDTGTTTVRHIADGTLALTACQPSKASYMMCANDEQQVTGSLQQLITTLALSDELPTQVSLPQPLHWEVAVPPTAPKQPYVAVTSVCLEVA